MKSTPKIGDIVTLVADKGLFGMWINMEFQGIAYKSTDYKTSSMEIFIRLIDQRDVVAILQGSTASY